MSKMHKFAYPLLVLGIVANCNAADLNYQVASHPVVKKMPRLGLNLGEWTAWGAAQFPNNILKNPGFEGLIDRAIVIVEAAEGLVFTDNNLWTARPDGFWTGAEFEVRSGRSAGKRGKITMSLAKGKKGFPEFFVAGDAPKLSQGDVIAITLVNDSGLPSEWWFPNDQLPGQHYASNQVRRPGSTGSRALVLTPMAGKSASVVSYLDAISGRAGKLLPINGLWKLRIWAKNTSKDAKLIVRFKRLNGTDPFFQETLPLTSKWQVFERQFTAQDTGVPETLELALIAEGTGVVMIDDVELGSADKSTHGFRQELVAALKQLHPGYLRDWQGQLGDTFSNRVADVFARRGSRYRPGQESTFSYGIPEFLQLAKAVGSQPWLIVPPTMGDKELQQLGRYLANKINVMAFSELVVEFGNENWNPLFRAAGIPDPAAHGAVANRAFKQLLLGAGNHPKIRTVINAQYANPWLSERYLENTNLADGLAIAPYFLTELNANDEVLVKLFAQDNLYPEHLAAVQKAAKDLLVYEVNLHTTSGDAKSAEREIATTSAAAGTALAKRLLMAMNLGIRHQCIYNLAQYDAFIDNGASHRELVKLWGIAKDLSSETLHLRPTGLAMALINRVLPANVHPIHNLGQDDPQLTASAFRNDAGWAAAFASGKASEQKITLSFPGSSQQSWRISSLKSPTPQTGNEKGEEVTISEQQVDAKENAISLTIPAYGLVVVSRNY